MKNGILIFLVCGLLAASLTNEPGANLSENLAALRKGDTKSLVGFQFGDAPDYDRVVKTEEYREGGQIFHLKDKDEKDLLLFFSGIGEGFSGLGANKGTDFFGIQVGLETPQRVLDILGKPDVYEVTSDKYDTPFIVYYFENTSLSFVMDKDYIITSVTYKHNPKEDLLVGDVIDFTTNRPDTRSNFNNGLLTGTNSKSEDVLLNYDGEYAVVFPENIRLVSDIIEDRARITDKNTELMGYADGDGQIVIPCQFEYCGNFSEGLAYAKTTDGVHGFIDVTGAFAFTVDADYKGHYPFHNGYSAFHGKDGNMGFIDKQGNVVIEPIYTYVSDFEDGYAGVEISGVGGGAINEKGEIVIPLIYQSRVVFSEGYGLGHSAEGYDIINRSCEVVSHVNYKSVCPFSDGLSCVFNDEGHGGYINPQGELVIGFTAYTIAEDFQEGFALVGTDQEHCGYINKDGVLMTPLDFTFVSGSFNEGHAIAIIDVDAYQAAVIRKIERFR